MEHVIKDQSGSTSIHSGINRTTIALQKDTKEKLDNSRAPGQCYDGFIRELVDYWERYRIGSSLCGPGRPVNQVMGR
jgi:hypothetical protein